MYDRKTMLRKFAALLVLGAVMAVPCDAFYRNMGQFQHTTPAMLRDVHLQVLAHGLFPREALAAGDLEGAGEADALSLPVLAYQDIEPAGFVAQMFALHAAGYRTVGLEDVRAFVAGTQPLPDKSFALTFDGTKAADYYAADPVLRSLGFTATLLLPEDFTPHGRSYDGEIARRDLEAIQRNERWSVVYGNTDGSGLMSFTKARLSRGDAVAEFGSHDLRVPRIPINADWPADQMLTVVQRTADQRLPFDDDTSTDRGWLTGWGVFSRQQYGYELGTDALHTSSFAFLDGGDRWRDYDFTASMIAGEGTDAIVAARVKRVGEDLTYVTCALDGSNASLHVRWAGADQKVVEVPHVRQMRDVPVKVGIAAHGQTFACVVDGQTVIAPTEIPLAASEGTVGLLTWHPEMGQARLVVSDIHATEAGPGF